MDLNCMKQFLWDMHETSDHVKFCNLMCIKNIMCLPNKSFWCRITFTSDFCYNEDLAVWCMHVLSGFLLILVWSYLAVLAWRPLALLATAAAATSSFNILSWCIIAPQTQQAAVLLPATEVKQQDRSNNPVSLTLEVATACMKQRCQVFLQIWVDRYISHYTHCFLNNVTWGPERNKLRQARCKALPWTSSKQQDRLLHELKGAGESSSSCANQANLCVLQKERLAGKLWVLLHAAE